MHLKMPAHNTGELSGGNQNIGRDKKNERAGRASKTSGVMLHNLDSAQPNPKHFTFAAELRRPLTVVNTTVSEFKLDVD